MNLLQVHAAPTQIINPDEESEFPKALKVHKITQDTLPAQVHPVPHIPRTPELSKNWGRPEVAELTGTVTRDEMEKKRQERILARWRKLGLLRDNAKTPYNRMKFVHFAQPIAWTHEPTAEPFTTTPLPRIITDAPKSPGIVTKIFKHPTETPENHHIAVDKTIKADRDSQSTVVKVSKTTTESPKTHATSKAFWADVFKSTTEEPMIRRINKHPIHVETPTSVFGRRAFGKQTLFNGPILGHEETPEIPPSKPITVSSDSFVDDTDGPIIEGKLFEIEVFQV